jgi:hypothetical protein
MYGEKLLGSIVVEVSQDGKTTNGTGFYISKNLIITCYHVLCSKSDSLKKEYWIRHDKWEQWENAEALENCCFPIPQDFAILRAYRENKGVEDIRLAAWDNQVSDFIAKGNDRTKRRYHIGTNTIEGVVIGRTTFKRYPRLQLRTKQKTIRKGRSGSPIWVLRQKAIVGMIVWVGEWLEAKFHEMALAIPIEEIVRTSIYLLKKNIEQLIPETGPIKTRNIAKNIATIYDSPTLANCLDSLKDSFERMSSEPTTQSWIIYAIGKINDSRAINVLQQIELSKQKKHPLVVHAIKRAIEQGERLC